MTRGTGALLRPHLVWVVASRLLLTTLFILGPINSFSVAASCERIAQPKFAHVPMRMAVISDANDADLSRKISYINANQDYYELVPLPENDIFAHVAIRLEFDALLVFDQEMMNAGAPKYNRYLHTYRNKDVSAQTMFIDFPFDKQGRIGFTFMQIAAANASARSLLMEIGLMALADLRLMSDAEFIGYYEQVDGIVELRDDELSPAVMSEIMDVRKEIVLACFLKAD